MGTIRSFWNIDSAGKPHKYATKEYHLQRTYFKCKCAPSQNMFFRDLIPSKIETVTRDVRSEQSGKIRQVWERDWSQQVEYMQVPNGTGPGIRRSTRPLSACYTCRECSMETSHKLVKVEFGKKATDWYKV